MLKLLQLLFVGHAHKWKILEQHQVYQKGVSNPFATDYILQCEHCGNIKKKRA